MKPLLFEGSILETPAYYVLYLFGFLGAVMLFSQRAKSKGFDPVFAIDLGAFSFLFGVIGARLFHIFFESPSYYLSHPVRIFFVWQGGFVLYGGLILGTIAGIFFLKKKGYGRSQILNWADLSVPSIFLGIAIGRMGCLAAGCCHGKVTQMFWGLLFTDPRSSAPLNVPLHPTQIIEALSALILCGLFILIDRRSEGSRKQGALFLWGIISYGIVRFFIEFLRGDLERGVYLSGSLSTSQMISLCVVLISLFALVFNSRERG